jgi:hypothetical protein
MDVTDLWLAPVVVWCPKRGSMFSAILLAVAALYAVFGAVIVRRLRKPTCRVCLNRQICPNRESEHSQPNRQPCWSCGQTIACAEPTPYSKA